MFDTRIIGRNIRIYREKAGYSQKEFAKLLGVANSTLSAYETGERGISDDVKINIAQLLKVTPNILFGVQDSKGVRIPVLGRVIAGVPIEAITEILDYEEIPETMAAQGEYFGLVAQGNSMSPTIVEGDVLIIRKQPFVENGKAAIVLVNGCEATVKRVHVTDSAVTLVADNPVAYPPHTYTKEEALCLPIKILGVVVEIRRKMI